MATHTGELGNGPTITQDGRSVTIETGDGQDTVTVDEDPGTHAVTVTINGVPYTYAGAQAQHITIRTQCGDDRIAVSDGTLVGVQLEAGAGSDTIFGGKGRDYIDAGAGADLVNSGDGDDVVYGGADPDTLIGLGGDDYIDGGSGDDRIAGDLGNDMLSGGLGNDFIEGDAGADKIYTGAGTDTVSGSGSTIYAQQGEDTTGDHPKVVHLVLQEIPELVEVSGPPGFRKRVLDDLEFLRSSPTGQQMLAALGSTEHKVTIAEGDNTAEPDSRAAAGLGLDNQPGPGSNATIFYDAERTECGGSYSETPYNNTPPSVFLFHELAHGYDFVYGTLRLESYRGADSRDSGIYEAERVALGLPIDQDDNTATPEQQAPEHPTTLTENAIRAELGLAPRDRYRPPS